MVCWVLGLILRCPSVVLRLPRAPYPPGFGPVLGMEGEWPEGGSWGEAPRKRYSMYVRAEKTEAGQIFSLKPSEGVYHTRVQELPAAQETRPAGPRGVLECNPSAAKRATGWVRHPLAGVRGEGRCRHTVALCAGGSLALFPLGGGLAPWQRGVLHPFPSSGGPAGDIRRRWGRQGIVGIRGGGSSESWGPRREVMVERCCCAPRCGRGVPFWTPGLRP